MEENKCTLTNAELIVKCNEWVSKLARTGGQAWTLRVPVDFNNDPDMLFCELGKRLEEYDEMETMRELADKLKAAVIENLCKSDEQEANAPYLYSGGKSYSRNGLIQEISEETEFGIKLMSNSVLLAIDLFARGKEKLKSN